MGRSLLGLPGFRDTIWHSELQGYRCLLTCPSAQLDGKLCRAGTWPVPQYIGVTYVLYFYVEHS